MPCCGGTGRVGKKVVGSGQYGVALLRSELIRVWGVAGSLERLAARVVMNMDVSRIGWR